MNDEEEGNGKNVFDSGHYYIGQFKNGCRHGKGAIYYPDGDILYEGDFFYDQMEGNGKEYYDNGEYYIVQFKYNAKDGKGVY